MIRMKNTSVRTRRLGNMTRYAPSTPAMAPEAPRFGRMALAPEWIRATCAAVAARPEAK